MTSLRLGTKHQLLLSLLVIGVLGSLAAVGTYSAFTATATNTGNIVSTGTVKIDQHAGATTLYNRTNQKPGDSYAACVRVSYTGSIASDVKLYVSSGITNGSQYTLTVERGSGLTTLDGTMSCAGFSATSTAYSGDLGSFATTYAAGYDGKASGVQWATNDGVDYRFTISQTDDPTPNAHTTPASSGAHTFFWEARST